MSATNEHHSTFATVSKPGSSSKTSEREKALCEYIGQLVAFQRDVINDDRLDHDDNLWLDPSPLVTNAKKLIAEIHGIDAERTPGEIHDEIAALEKAIHDEQYKGRGYRAYQVNLWSHQLNALQATLRGRLEDEVNGTEEQAHNAY